VVGADRVAYGRQRTDGKTWKQEMLETADLDRARLHFTGMLDYDEYLRVLQASTVHVYLTRPFILSWSMLEAMACECLVVASGTAPVTEVIADGENGLLVDFFSAEAIAEKIAEALDDPAKMNRIRQTARRHVIENYNLTDLLPKHLEWIESVISDR
jgi:glycosyltransferase involved in cell wall biosynthesis